MTLKQWKLDVINQIQSLEEVIQTGVYTERQLTDRSNHLIVSYLAMCKHTHDKQLKTRLSNKIDNLLNKIEILKSEVD